MTDEQLQNAQDTVVLSSPSRLDKIGFKARRGCLEIRDCIAVHRPDGPVYGLLVRKQMDSTVADSVLKEGKGVLGIDRSRINGEGGRYPSNFILRHHDECEIIGTKKVKTGMASKKSNPIGVNNIYGDMKSHESYGSSGYADKDGKEEVPDWNCQPSCPVKLLDEQSGVLERGFMEAGVEYTNNSATYGHPSGKTQMDTYGDKGGASRFFQQVQSEDELDEYLNALIRKKE